MDRAKLKTKLSLRKKKTGSTSSGANEKTAKLHRGRRAALAAPFSQSKTDKGQLKLYLAAVENGNSVRVGELLAGGLELSEIDEDSESLRFACRRGHMETVAVLLRHGAEVNRLGDEESGPIHIASRLGNGGLVALLLSQGATVDLKSRFERKTALHVAVLHGKDHVARLLLENGADLEQGDIYGTAPLHIAARMANLPTLEVLVHFKPDINSYDNDGWTALHLAADSGNLKVAQMLLAQHCQVDCQNKYGRTPLQWACSKGHLSMVRLLLDYQAAVSLKDLHGKCSLDYATNREIKSLLQANVKVADKNPASETGHSIGKYITMDPRESLLRKVYSDSPGSDTKESDLQVMSALRIPTIMEDDNESSSTNTHKAPTNNNRPTDVDEAFVDHDSLDDTHSVCFSIESASSPRDGCKRPRTLSDTVATETAQTGLAVRRQHAGLTPSVSVSTLRSACSDTQSSSSGPFVEGKDMLKKLTKSLSAHNERLTKEIRFLYNAVSKSILSSDEEKYLESLKSAKARLELMENSMHDFQEDTEMLAKKMRENMNSILDDSTAKPASPEQLSPRFFIAMFHSVGAYIGRNTGMWKNVVKGLAKRSVEKEYDIEKAINSASESEFGKVFACLDYLVKRSVSNGTPFMKDLLHFITVICNFGEEARTMILYEFINSVTLNKPSDLSTGQMFNLSEKLQEAGKDLALPLGLTKNDLRGYDWKKAPHSSNMDMMTLWHDRTEGLSTLGRVCQMTAACIDIGREDLLAIVFQ